MSLTKVSHSMINGAALNVFDYLSAAEILEVQSNSPTAPIHVKLQVALDEAKISRKAVFFPSGTYLIGDTLNYTTPNDKLEDDPNNGLEMFGEVGTVIKVASTWTTTKAMLNLDGNPSASELVVAYCQTFNNIYNIHFDGSGLADRGLRLRANWFGKFSNLYLHNFKGSGLGVIHIVGVTTPTKDDADTTQGCIFTHVRIQKSVSGYGILGVDNRCGAITLLNCDIRDCYGDGIRLAVAGLSIYGCTVAGNGNAAQNNTGGVSIVRSQTLARTRGVAIHGCEFENNFWHEVNIDYCFGFTITGCFGSPYQRSTIVGPSWIRMGNTAAEGGNISGNSTMDYSDTYGYNIRIYDFFAGASNISVNNAVIQRSTNVDYLVDPSATKITHDGVIISADKLPAFSAYMTNGSADKVISSNTFTKVQLDTKEFDQSNGFDSDTEYRFTPALTGFYQINAGLDFTPSNTATRGMLVLYKNGAAYKRMSDSLNVGGQISGGALVYLTASDYVELFAYITAVTPTIAYGSTITYMNGSLVTR